MVPVPLKSLNVPLLTLISPTSKSIVDSLLVKVNERLPSLEVNPSTPSDDVMVIVGAVPSYNQLNSSDATFPLPIKSVKRSANTLIVTAPSLVGVNVAV